MKQRPKIRYYWFIDISMRDIIRVIDISLYTDGTPVPPKQYIEQFYNGTVDSGNAIWTSRMRTRVILIAVREEFIKRSQYTIHTSCAQFYCCSGNNKYSRAMRYQVLSINPRSEHRKINEINTVAIPAAIRRTSLSPLFVRGSYVLPYARDTLSNMKYKDGKGSQLFYAARFTRSRWNASRIPAMMTYICLTVLYLSDVDPNSGKVCANFRRPISIARFAWKLQVDIALPETIQSVRRVGAYSRFSTMNSSLLRASGTVSMSCLSSRLIAKCK